MPDASRKRIRSRGLAGPSPSGESTSVFVDARGVRLFVGDRVAQFPSGRTGVIVRFVRLRVRVRWDDRAYVKPHASKANQAELYRTGGSR